MKQMPDLMEALNSLQEALDRGFPFEMKRCELSPDYDLIIDGTRERPRFTYLKIVNGEVQSIANFVVVQPINGVPCFNFGYAVKPNFRGRGLAREAVTVGINEMKNGWGRAGAKEFYVEAVIDVTNKYSIKVAEALFPDNGKETKDHNTGTLCMHFVRLITI